MFTGTLHRALRSCLAAGSLLAALLPASQAFAQPRPPQADMTIDAAERQKVIDGLIRDMKENYIFPAQAKKVEAALRAQQKRGAYDSISSAEKLAAALTEELQKQTSDKHLQVRYSEQPLPPQSKDLKPGAEELAAELEQMKGLNFGVERIERLNFNIGYLDLRMFPRTKEAAPTFAAAATLLANTNALIIDLRKNGGGDPATVAMLASYLLDERIHLNDIYNRKGDFTEQVWSNDNLAGKYFGGKKDVYILTSKFTFSGAEDLAYTLQSLKRVTVVGEVTGGGAHPGDVMHFHPHFGAFIPNARSINPVTKTNWEGVGVKPDVAVKAEDAYKTAQVMILKKMMEAEKNPRRAERLKARIAEVEAEDTSGQMKR